MKGEAAMGKRWNVTASVHMPDDVDVGHDVSVHGGTTWLNVRPDQLNGGVAFFGSAMAARRLADGATKWAEYLEAAEQREEASDA